MQNLQLVFFLEYFIKHPIMLIIIIIDIMSIDHRLYVTLGSWYSINSSMINWTKIFHKFWFSQGLSKYRCRWWGFTVQRNKKALSAVVNILILTIRRGAGFENACTNEKIIQTCKGFLRLRRDGKIDRFFLEKKNGKFYIFQRTHRAIMMPSEVAQALGVPRSYLLNRNY